jgi:hypothetical protein
MGSHKRNVLPRRLYAVAMNIFVLSRAVGLGTLHGEHFMIVPSVVAE